MAKSICVENETEALVALQAVETYRALQQAVKTAPHGKALATVEAVVHDRRGRGGQAIARSACVWHVASNLYRRRACFTVDSTFILVSRRSAF